MQQREVEQIYYSSTIPSPIGPLTMATDKDAICLIGLWMEGQKHFGGAIKDQLQEQDDLPIFQDVKDWLDRYFKGQKSSSDELPLKPMGTDFRLTVWEELLKIPYGETTCYGAIAKNIAKDKEKAKHSSRAVGGAVGHNPISIIIPCHRVLGANGQLTGFSGGLENKIKLLALEKEFS